MTARTVQERARLVLQTVGGGPVGGRHAETGARALDPLAAVAAALDAGGNDVLWLALCVMDGRFPEPGQVRDARRLVRRSGGEAYVRRWRRPPTRLPRRPVEVVTDRVVVDVHHTARTTLATGIQRVARQVLRHWPEPVLLVGWDPRMTSLRTLSAQEEANAVWGGRPPARPSQQTVVVPWRCRYLLPELAVEPARTSRLAALAEFSGNGTTVIGFDCVPLTSGETTGAGMGAAFARNLSAVAQFGQVVPISRSAAREYDGWRQMLRGAGLRGPRITPVELAWEAPLVEEHPEQVAAELLVGDLPLVLCVGSHEPRKNHPAVLYAAEALWQQGQRFSVAFVGGNSWNTEHVQTEVARLQALGRPVVTASGVSDRVLSAAYRVARVVVFPSLNEGFGLPVTEALAAGTPVVTSDFGSMAEIGAGNGALLVDPRDDDSLTAGLRQVLEDEPTRARLRQEIAALRTRSWVDYTRELSALVLAEADGAA